MDKYSIIAVDFDGTLSLGIWPEVGPANIELIEHLQILKREGNKIILWTCRTGEDLAVAVNWCKEYGLEFDSVNDNLPEIIETYGCNSRKISCDYYIDDKAMDWTRLMKK